jgi:aspartate dehydrogenase
MLRIALVGCGAIGSSLLELLQGDPGIVVTAIVVPAEFRAAAANTGSRLHRAAQISTHIPLANVDLVIETAGHAAIEEHVLPALRRGTPCIVASVGALSADGLLQALRNAAEAGHSQVELIAGAMGGIDALAAASIGGLDFVRYTGRKPPLAWSGTPAEQSHDLRALSRATVIFEGSAREAASLFPKNANVAATLSLAGLGFDRTSVRLIADPAVEENLHTVEASGAFGSFALTMRNKPLAANPKTSALTVYSALRALRNRSGRLAI